MDTLSDIKNKISKCFQTNDVDFLISLKAFLCDKQDCPWIVLNESICPQDVVDYLQNNTLAFYINLNRSNLKKYRVSEIDIFMLPKNKKLVLVSEINEIFDVWNITILTDELRCCPFQSDTLGNYIKSNDKDINEETINKYNERKTFLKKLFVYSDYKKTIYCTSSVYAKNNKIKEYWMNIWGDPSAYRNNSSSIENILL